MKRKLIIANNYNRLQILSLEGVFNESYQEGQIFRHYKHGEVKVYKIEKIEYEYVEESDILRTILLVKE